MVGVIHVAPCHLTSGDLDHVDLGQLGHPPGARLQAGAEDHDLWGRADGLGPDRVISGMARPPSRAACAAVSASLARAGEVHRPHDVS